VKLSNPDKLFFAEAGHTKLATSKWWKEERQPPRHCENRRMPGAGELVREMYEAFQRRDWDACEPLLHPKATYDAPRTAEHLEGGDSILEYMRTYPEPWGDISVLRVVADGDEAAAEIAVTGGHEGEFRLAAFWTAREGQLYRGVEYWTPLPSD
jgi:ketosteroid isomerase-like protein